MTVHPIRMSSLAGSHTGRWVALRNGEVLETGETFDELARLLDEHRVRDATVRRVLAAGEAELVGLG